MDHVVAVHRVTPQPVAEAHLHFHVARWNEPDHVLSGQIDAGAVAAAAAPAVLAAPSRIVVGVVPAAAVKTRRARGDLELLEVHVDRMRPSEAAVEIPLLERVLLDAE